MVPYTTPAITLNVDASNGAVALQNWDETQSNVNYFCTCTWCY